MSDLALRIVAHQLSHWMPFNLFLAFVPVPIGASLFERSVRVKLLCLGALVAVAGFYFLHSDLVGSTVRTLVFAGLAVAALAPVLLRGGPRNPLWWLGLVVFVLFLPNSAYVITDGLHLVQGVRATDGLLPQSLVFAPVYALYTLGGLACFVACVYWLGSYVGARRPRARTPVELALLAFMSVGLYIGRIEQLHSWYPFTYPELTRRALERQLHVPIVWAFVGATFACLAIAYFPLRSLISGWGRSLLRAVVVVALVAAAGFSLATLLVIHNVRGGLPRTAPVVTIVAMALAAIVVAGVVVRGRRGVAVTCLGLALGPFIAAVWLHVADAQRRIVPGVCKVQHCVWKDGRAVRGAAYFRPKGFDTE